MMNENDSPSHATRTAPLVLVADDDPVYRMMMTETLDRAGCEVVSTADGNELITAATHLAPSAIIVDVMMPGTNGLQAIHALRATIGESMTPVIVVSGLADAHTRDLAIDLGATDFIVKPVRPSTLVARVRRFLPLPIEWTARPPCVRRLDVHPDGRYEWSSPPPPGSPLFGIDFRLIINAGEAVRITCSVGHCPLCGRHGRDNSVALVSADPSGTTRSIRVNGCLPVQHEPSP